MTREGAKEIVPIIKNIINATPKDAEHLLSVITAFSKGKPIQFLDFSDPEDTWGTDDMGDEIAFTNSPKCYRIKPEPKVRPFKNAIECFQEMIKHQPMGWVKCKALNKINICCITHLYDKSGYCFADSPAVIPFDSDLVTEFTDGKPFGIVVEG